jgi:hypothetical protein
VDAENEEEAKEKVASGEVMEYNWDQTYEGVEVETVVG